MEGVCLWWALMDSNQRPDRYVIVEVLKQKNNEPVDVAHQVCIIYAVVNGYLNTIPVEDIREFERQLFAYMNDYHYEALNSIRTSGALDEAAETAIKTALTELASKFVSAN